MNKRNKIWSGKLVALIIASVITGLIGCSSSVGNLSEKERVDSLRSASLPVRSIDPADDHFDDLPPLTNIIGNRHFVLMTETTHEDGATFDARARLIRFLHEKMGFDVVSIEHSYVTIGELCQALKTSESYGEYISQHPREVYPLFTQRSLMDYIQSTQVRGDHPVSLMGHSVYYFWNNDLIPKLTNFLARTGLEPLNRLQAERFEAILKPLTATAVPKKGLTLMVQDTPYKETVAEFNAINALLVKYIEEHHEQMSKATSPEELAYFEGLVQSLPGFVALSRAHNPHDPRLDFTEMNKRDEAMAHLIINAARNLFPKRKMVICSADAHILPDAGTFKSEGGVTSMGANLLREFGRDQVYTIVFEAYSGKNGSPARVHPILPASSKSLAGLFHQIGGSYRFLDLTKLPNGHWLRRTPLGLRMVYLPDGFPVIWPDVCSGVFYIEEQYPAR